MRYQPKASSSTSKYGSPKQGTEDNNVASVQVRSQVTPQVSPLAQVNTLAQPTHTNSFPPPPYFPIPFPPLPFPGELVNSFHHILSINDVIILSINDVIAYQS